MSQERSNRIKELRCFLSYIEEEEEFVKKLDNEKLIKILSEEFVHNRPYLSSD